MPKKRRKVATPTGPTPRQLEALQDYAEWAGPRWKVSLRRDWLRAGSRWSGDYTYLHQLRNTLGPKWLNEFKLPERV